MGLPIYGNIDKLIKEKGMSRRQLALKAGINPSTISVAFMKQNTMFHPTNLQKIADALDVTTDELVNGPAEVIKANMDGKEGHFYNPGKGHPSHVWTEEEIKQEINADLKKLNLGGQKTAMERVKELTLIEKYTKKSPDPEESEE